MRDFREYLRAYWVYVRTHGWVRALAFVLVWVAGMFVPAGLGELVELPKWLAITWMIGWAMLGYIFAPYGMWKQQRKAALKSVSLDRGSSDQPK
ncbi:hypothetical protein [Bradyrhizobium sp. LHD-71]|uniref:hypothetical protein n=1 Tax=Bradyrhizobium sp. LHD-71 TaxID=3072141 RepID=UPI00280F7F5E|nr:hypothetical protein [Bradyrhizobium sp. LHD-71]MDQ8729263.1 hypothetical protein [Bradyrhizobium sp. LHD-71]